MIRMPAAGRVLLLPAALLLVAGCGSSATSSPTSTAPPPTTAPAPSAGGFTVELVTDTGGLGNKSFNDLAWKSLTRARTTLRVTPTVVQPSDPSQYVRDLSAAAQHGTGLIVAVGYGMSHAVYTVANTFPSAEFALIDAVPLDDRGAEVKLPNVADILFREQDAGYVAGVIAGLMEKQRIGHATHNTIGYLGGQPIPAVDHYLAGYVAGAQSVDPGISIVGDYAGSFTNTATGTAIAQRQISQGADILFQVAAQAGAAYLGEAGRQHRYGIGVDANQRYLGTFMLTSAVKRVGNALRRVVAQARNGQFRGGDQAFGAAQHATGFAPVGPEVPASIVTRARQVQTQIAAGKIVPPTVIPAH